ncbi:enoyl-CoA hydratase [Aeromicrobium sp. A1-2]|uniref:enoyl-CoA hydratase n=1 Tax=Aeromicrobium sp. A1-2 TaxID=2107713 RepID=UPI000E539E15|nr:enoyl-CoA hydratase [Aeromicrobium sp. A1-2]AXT86607.1 enoyl-CoA hydratase [Aeromicrobium sp. A1-2]
MSLVLLETQGHVRTIRLNAPERRNALDWPLLDEFAAAVRVVADDPEARALVVAGNGSAFCAGANLENLFGDLDRPVEQMRDHLMTVYASFLGLRDLTIPTIAAVQGPAVGAGLNIALACDIIVAGPKAGFGPTFAEIGLHPGGGCTWMLTERIGAGNARAALLSGAVIRSEEALRLGLANVLADEPVAAAVELAQKYAARDPQLNADILHSVQIASTSDFDTSLDFESRAQAESFGREQFRTYMARFLAKD